MPSGKLLAVEKGSEGTRSPFLVYLIVLKTALIFHCSAISIRKYAFPLVCASILSGFVDSV